MYTYYALHQDFKSPVQALEHFYKRGIRYADVTDDEFKEYPLHQWYDYVTEAGLKPASLVALVNIAAFSKKEREYNLSIVKGYIDQMEKLNIPIIMLNPQGESAGSDDELKIMRENMINAYSEVIEYAKGSGIKVATENYSLLDRADSRMKDLRYILDAVPELGLVLDSGNFFCVGEDVLEAYELLADRLVHAHFKDWKWDPYGHAVRENMPRFEGEVIGKGMLPLKELIARFKRDGYDGKVVLEINALKISLTDLEESADFLVKEVLGGEENV